jgi:hypothetical protein
MRATAEKSFAGMPAAEKNRQEIVLHMPSSFVIALLLLGGAGPASAQQEIIIAERPGFSSSPIALSPSTLQIESGYQYSQDNAGADARNSTLPFALIRIGIIDRVEIQLNWAGYSWTETGNVEVNGKNDASIGVKWQFAAADAKVAVALFASLSLPVGDTDFSSDAVDPSIGAFWTYSGGMDWFGTLLLSESDDDILTSNAVGVSLPINENSGAFLEYVASFPEGSGPHHVLNSGITYLPRSDLQLDFNAGLGLNTRATDFSIGMGLAFRF